MKKVTLAPIERNGRGRNTVTPVAPATVSFNFDPQFNRIAEAEDDPNQLIITAPSNPLKPGQVNSVTLVLNGKTENDFLLVTTVKSSTSTFAGKPMVRMVVPILTEDGQEFSVSLFKEHWTKVVENIESGDLQGGMTLHLTTDSTQYKNVVKVEF